MFFRRKDAQNEGIKIIDAIDEQATQLEASLDLSLSSPPPDQKLEDDFLDSAAPIRIGRFLIEDELSLEQYPIPYQSEANFSAAHHEIFKIDASGNCLKQAWDQYQHAQTSLSPKPAMLYKLIDHFSKEALDEFQGDEKGGLCAAARQYNPDLHCWDVNAAWMLGQIHRHREFVLLSNLNDKTIMRTHDPIQYSALVQEISCLRKAGYSIAKIEYKFGSHWMSFTPPSQNLNIPKTIQEIKSTAEENKAAVDWVYERRKRYQISQSVADRFRHLWEIDDQSLLEEIFPNQFSDQNRATPSTQTMDSVSVDSLEEEKRVEQSRSGKSWNGIFQGFERENSKIANLDSSMPGEAECEGVQLLTPKTALSLHAKLQAQLDEVLKELHGHRYHELLEFIAYFNYEAGSYNKAVDVNKMPMLTLEQQEKLKFFSDPNDSNNWQLDRITMTLKDALNQHLRNKTTEQNLEIYNFGVNYGRN